MGSGKSYWGRLLSTQLQVPYYDLDEVIEKNTGQTIRHIFDTKGEAHFRELEKETLAQLIAGQSNLVLSTGGGTPCYFNNIDLMKESGTVVWLNPSLDLVCKRLIHEKDKRPLLKNISDTELRSFVLKKMNDRRIYYEQAQVHVNGDEVSLDQLAKQILHA